MARDFLRAITGAKVQVVTIESSPGKYWLLTDVVGTLEDCLDFMSRIPGVNHDWLSYCHDNDGMYLRGYPKWEQRLQWDDAPIAIRVDGAFGGRFKTQPQKFFEWMCIFREYWTSDFITSLTSPGPSPQNFEPMMSNPDAVIAGHAQAMIDQLPPLSLSSYLTSSVGSSNSSVGSSKSEPETVDPTLNISSPTTFKNIDV
jgi:hypothetical protein